MGCVVLISRHRQWRAWQFGVRHSGLWRNSGSTSSGGGDDDPFSEWYERLPWWGKILAVLGMLTLLWIIWETGLLVPLGIIGLLMLLFK